jgi:hypothetical protein
MTFQQILAHFENVRRDGAGYVARCPTHEDRNPSLGISEGRDGRVLVNCRAGCRTADVLAAKGLSMRDLFPERPAPAARPATRRTTRYKIRDSSGVLVAVHVREDRPGGKRFWWERPDGARGLGGVRTADLPLYGAERLAAAPGAPVILVEGEKAATALRRRGYLAVGTVTGAPGTPADDVLRVLLGRPVGLWPDADEPGRLHMQRIAASLRRLGHDDVRLIEWPGAPAGGDAADFTGDAAALAALLAGARPIISGRPPVAPVRDADPAGGEAADDAGERHADLGDLDLRDADLLVQLATGSGAEFFHDPDGNGYATVPAGTHRETWRLSSTGFKTWAQHLFYRMTGRSPNAEAVRTALGTLEGRARYEGPTHRVWSRVAERDGAIYLDLADADWRVVKITAEGWRVVTDSPVKFRRTRGMLPIPSPAAGGSLDDLRRFVNVARDDDWKLVVAWLVATLRPDRPFPVLFLHGEPGSAKTTTARLLRALVDPNVSPVRSAPKDTRDLMIAAKNGFVVAFDNLSHIAPALSDDLCRLATGGGFATRQLYSDDEEVLFDAVRPVVINGIEDLATRGDLIDRALLVELPSIPPEDRRPEAALWADFDQARPKLLGALLDAVAVALATLPGTTISPLPRMADFTLWVEAAAPALGWERGDFTTVYTKNRQEGNDLALDASPVGTAILKLMATRTTWEGSASDLLADLGTQVDERVRLLPSWPKAPRGMSGALRRVAQNLRAVGIVVDLDLTRRGAGRRLGLSKAPERPSPPTLPSPGAVSPRSAGGSAGDGPEGDRHQPSLDRHRASVPHGARNDGGDGRDGRPPEAEAPEADLERQARLELAAEGMREPGTDAPPGAWGAWRRQVADRVTALRARGRLL